MRDAPLLGRTATLAVACRALSLRALLLASAVGCLCAGSPAHAQFLASGSASATAAPLPDDGLGPRDAYIEADTMVDDRDNQIVTARGHVEARTQGRTIRSDELIYNRKTGEAHAVGNVALINPDGTVQYAQDIQLDEKLRAGVATGFAARQQQNVTIAAGAAIRRTETVQQLNNAIFTPCNICKDDGVTPKTPTWSIQAKRIIQDRDHAVIYYQNAILRIKNIPIMFFPIFWTPDPSVERRSGFLTPSISTGKRRGFSYEQPYYWAISPYNDLTISPQINSRVNPLLNLQYRQRFYSGQIDIRTGYTYERNFTSKLFYDKATSRSYVLGSGKFNIDKNWIWGFGLERVTDPTFFRRYSIRDVFVDRGPFPTDTDRLISQVYTQRQTRQSFASIAALSFQSIRAFGQDPVTGGIFGESGRYFPLVGPLIEARFDPKTPILGGRLRGQFSAVALHRGDNIATALVDPSNTVLPAGPLQNPRLLPFFAPAGQQTISWSDSRRATAQVDWRRAFTVGPGIRVEPFGMGRGDVYWLTNYSTGLSNLYPVNSVRPLATGKDEVVTRGLGTVGADLTWPLYRSFGRSSVIIEPIAQLAWSPKQTLSNRIPNEDSVSFTFDESTLFAPNRSFGFDLFEGGARLNAGLRANAWFSNGGTASLLVGRTFRADPNPIFSPQSGLRGTGSDWIVSARAAPIRGFSVFTSSRLDADTLAVRRQEAGISADYGPVRSSARYVYNETGLVFSPTGAITVGKVETVDLSGEVRFLKHWGVGVVGSRDLQQQIWPRAQLNAFYEDECIRVDVIYTHDEYVGRIDPSDSIGIRLTLATLGDTTRRGTRTGGR